MNNSASDFIPLAIQVTLALTFDSVYACGMQGTVLIIHCHQFLQFYDINGILVQ